MDNKLELCILADKIQDNLLDFINKVNESGQGCLSRDIEVDYPMLLFYDQDTWQKFVDVFDILGFDFTTGEPDGEAKTWYIDFEFSDGISD